MSTSLEIQILSSFFYSTYLQFNLPFLSEPRTAQSLFTSVQSLSRVRLSATPGTAACQAFEHSLAFPFFGIGMKTDLFQRRVAAAAKSLQSCPTLCNPIDSSPPGSPIPGILQARTLEWVAISFSNA